MQRRLIFVAAYSNHMRGENASPHFEKTIKEATLNLLIIHPRPELQPAIFDRVDCQQRIIQKRLTIINFQTPFRGQLKMFTDSLFSEQV